METRKAFSLAEILIALMITGIIAMLTVPTVTVNFRNAHFKTAYKRAYNIITNIITTEVISGEFPYFSAYESPQRYKRLMHDTLTSKLSFKDYYVENVQEGLTELPENPDYSTLWINTDDGLSYKIFGETTNSPKTKAQLRTYSTGEELQNNSAYYILVDVNGYRKGPNCEDERTATGLEEGQAMGPLKCDRYPIYIATDGTTTGHKNKTIVSRILEEAE